MRIVTAGAAAALLIASAFGAMALPSSQAIKGSTEATPVQSTAPQTYAQKPKAQAPKGGKHAMRHKAHKSAAYRTSHRYKASKSAKRTGTKAQQKGAQKAQRPS
jgi:hypothetical protein